MKHEEGKIKPVYYIKANGSSYWKVDKGYDCGKCIVIYKGHKTEEIKEL